MSISQVLKRATKRVASVDYQQIGKNARTAGTMIGRRFRSNVMRLNKRHVRSAMLANAAVGAVGGGIYGGVTSGDWRSGAMTGAAFGAGLWSVGGLRTLRGAMSTMGLLERKAVPRGVVRGATGLNPAAVGQAAETATAVVRTGSRGPGLFSRARQRVSGMLDSAAARYYNILEDRAFARQARIRARAAVLMAEELGAHNAAMMAAREARRVDERLIRAALRQEQGGSLGRAASQQAQRRSRNLRGRRG